MQVPSTPPRTPTLRYPTHLSRCSDKPARPLLQHRGTSHMYESLEDLLTEAGYKETRIFTPEGPTRTAETSSTKGTVGNVVVKLLSTWMPRDPTESSLHPKPYLRHTISAPHMHQDPPQDPPSPSWLTSLFTPRTPPSTPSRRRPAGQPRLLSHPRAVSSYVAVTKTNVVCRPTAVRASSCSSSSTRSSGKSRHSSRSRGAAVPTLLCQSHQKEHDCDDQNTPPPSSTDQDDDDDDDSDGEGEVDLSRILIPAKRQHSIRSLRAVLLQNPQRPSTPTRRISSLNPSRDKPRLLTESRDSNRTPRCQHPHRHYQSSLPVRITHEPLYEEPANVADEGELVEGEDGHWDSGEFMSARVKRLRGGLPRAWGTSGQ